MSSLEIHLLGSPRFLQGGQRLHFGRRKSVALLSYLAVTRQPQSREALAALFWPDLDESTARMNLRRHLSEQRKMLGDEVLLVDRLQVEFNTAAGAQVDVYQFERALAGVQGHTHSDGNVCQQCAQILMQAVDLYQGEFMAGFSLPDCAEFDEWLFFQREQRRREAAAALQQLVDWCSEQKLYDQGIGYGRRWLSLDPWHEPAHRALMKLYAWSDQQAAALRQYEECQRLLDEELGIEPEAETTALFHTIRNRTFPPAPAEAAVSPAAAGVSPAVTNLPPLATPFVGRQTEVDQIQRLLVAEPNCRLLTLVGPGGIGKTRLALQATAELHNAFSDGITFISLTPVAAADNLVPAIARGLNLTFIGARDLQAQLIDYLCEKQRLLILDNFEHLIDGAGLLANILAEAEAVKILVTSRERLRLQVEWTFDVQGLECPDEEALAREQPYAAVTLFEQSARRVQTDFAPNQEERVAVARICRLVQGMPLAIELAATWVKLLSYQEIAAEIEQGLDFLAAELQDVPERQRSIRAVFQHSWNLTPETEREIFAKLSVFRGGFTREAASQLAGASLMTLSSLADKSLIRRNSAGRYEIHELLRQYGADKLRQNAATRSDVQRRHAAYFAVLMRQHQDSYYSGQRMSTTRAINEEIDNIRAAWQWALAHKEYDTLGQCVMSLYFFYETQGWYREGEALFRTAVFSLQDSVDKSDDRDLELRLNYRSILTSLAWFCFRLARYEEAQRLIQQSLPFYRTAQDREGLWMATELSANVAYNLGQYEEARRFTEDNLQLLQDIGYEWLWATGQSLTDLGRIYMALGNYEKARKLLVKGIAPLKEVGDQLGTLLSLHTLGRMYQALGDLSEAENAYQECLELGRLNELPLGEAVSLNDLGNLAYQQGGFTRAKDQYGHSLKIFREIGDRRGRALALTNLGRVNTALGEYEEAAQHYQQSRTICEETRNRRGLALTLTYLSDLSRIREDYAGAEALNQESLNLCREIGYAKGVALAVQKSGDLALDLGDYGEAQQRYQESLEIYGNIGFQEGRIECHAGLGRAALQVGENQAARRYFHLALAGASTLQSVPQTLDTLVNLAALLSAEGAADKAWQLLALAVQHAASTRQTQEKAERLLQEVAAGRPPELVAVAPTAVGEVTTDILALSAQAMKW